jgi:hypothetical protein
MRREVQAVDSEREAGSAEERFVPVGLSSVIAAREGTAGRDVNAGEEFWAAAGVRLYDPGQGLVPVYSEPRSDALLFRLPADGRLQRLARADLNGEYDAIVHLPPGGNPGTRQSWQHAGYATLDPRDGHPEGERCPQCSGPAGPRQRPEGQVPANRHPRTAAPHGVPSSNASRR